MSARHKLTFVGQWVVEQERLPGCGRDSEIGEDMVLLPGFVDCHTHLLWGGSRATDFERRNSGMTYQEILNSGGGIFDTDIVS